ncbi:hypothetical protein [Amycolatopsis cihanbeyliensis]|uniref:Uncharacterized protein n=1 Tax=Amycolatopsis cihanbeyliensis TaxID=1128664 RepID=A0A542CTL3_AMYCI|nr:hypothetical protein [Amycolatopsis cihanbeyliensis]TQI94161.1 hypothetical protein FB471_6319 [Amycolatopsis cihanbeyliensis]
MNELVRLWRRAVTAELCWREPDGAPAALTATPLLLAGGTPCVALPYARAGEVAGLTRATRVAFAVTDSRSLPDGAPGALAIGGLARHEDTSGELFTVELLQQELAKYPPSRTLADSPLLCRENWWWLPRIILRLDRIDRVVELPARTNPARQALVVRGGDSLAVEVAEPPGPAGWSGERVELRPRPSWPATEVPALAFGYDYTMPDLERWEAWSRRGVLAHDALVVTHGTGEPEGTLTPLPLLGRIRRQHSLARACRRAITAAERAGQERA